MQQWDFFIKMPLSVEKEYYSVKEHNIFVVEEFLLWLETIYTWQ